MMKMRIISNNPDVWNAFTDVLQVIGSPYDVLREGRNLVHQGWKLYSHPFHGNMRLLKNPYRSVVLEYNAGVLDMTSLLTIEEACARLEIQRFDDTGENQEDYRFLDADLLKITFPQ